MKFLSFFSKAPTHQRFHYEPRYYDEYKERNKDRMQRNMRGSLTVENGDETSYRSRLFPGSLQLEKRLYKAKRRSMTSTTMRLVIILLMVIWLVFYLTWGSLSFYLLGAVLIPLYIYAKWKRK